MNNNIPIIWSVAGSDSCAGAGMQADIKTASYLQVHCCSIITVLTAQNTATVSDLAVVSSEMFRAQVLSCADEFMPSVIKSGLIGNVDQAIILADFLERHPDIIYICDPVIVSTSGVKLCDDETLSVIKKRLIPRSNLVTPNQHELRYLLELDYNETNRERTSKTFLDTYHCASILNKGGDIDSGNALDIWISSDGEIINLSTPKYGSKLPFHGTGCSLATAIASYIAKGESIQNAIILAKHYLTKVIVNSDQLMRCSSMLNHHLSDEIQLPFPYIQYHNIPNYLDKTFPKESDNIGFYPIVDSAKWVEKLSQWGVTIVQLRIKDKPIEFIEAEIINALSIASISGIKVYINDYWKLAIKHCAYGVHLGQDDLEDADLDLIKTSGIRLGISTHDHYELFRAIQISPSYIALGPIFHTDTKKMRFKPQGLKKIKTWKQLIGMMPLVAIGGITLGNMSDIYIRGASGIAVISYVTKSDIPEHDVRKAIDISSKRYFHRGND
ncbi:bifunctional hydroxymethylpyrimidine kinase/phosphomethylpyrimidine kinase [Francisellaceae bacterium]|nr:bifunctional hydroxymethylpyrimidine kinase/phosphomethylpyrimidine kinase [Francisellaceae bacterium]